MAHTANPAKICGLARESTIAGRAAAVLGWAAAARPLRPAARSRLQRA